MRFNHSFAEFAVRENRFTATWLKETRPESKLWRSLDQLTLIMQLVAILQEVFHDFGHFSKPEL